MRAIAPQRGHTTATSVQKIYIPRVQSGKRTDFAVARRGQNRPGRNSNSVVWTSPVQMVLLGLQARKTILTHKKGPTNQLPPRTQNQFPDTHEHTTSRWLDAHPHENQMVKGARARSGIESEEQIQDVTLIWLTENGILPMVRLKMIIADACDRNCLPCINWLHESNTHASCVLSLLLGQATSSETRLSGIEQGVTVDTLSSSISGFSSSSGIADTVSDFGVLGREPACPCPMRLVTHAFNG